MKDQSEIPDSWEVTDVEVVTVNPKTGEVVDELSSSGAGPQVSQVRGTIKSKPCDNCDDEMVYEAPMGALNCLKCGMTASPKIQDHDA